MELTEFDQMRALALKQLLNGQSLTGKDGVFAPLIKQFIETALEAEMANHLDEDQRSKGNKRNGKKSKKVKTLDGEFEIFTPQDRHSSFEPQLWQINSPSHESVLFKTGLCITAILLKTRVNVAEIKEVAFLQF